MAGQLQNCSASGDFQLNTVQLVGGVMGTGSDFRWVGELRAAAAKAYGTNIAGSDSAGCAGGLERWSAYGVLQPIPREQPWLISREGEWDHSF